MSVVIEKQFYMSFYTKANQSQGNGCVLWWLYQWQCSHTYGHCQAQRTPKKGREVGHPHCPHMMPWVLCRCMCVARGRLRCRDRRDIKKLIA